MIQSMRTVKISSAACSVFALVAAVSACQERSHSGYLATGKELALNQKYRGLPELPGGRAVFEAALKTYGLRTEERVVNFSDDKPLTCSGPDGVSQELKRRVDRCLLISGQATKEAAERYVAFIDSRGHVIFVENVFEYPGR